MIEGAYSRGKEFLPRVINISITPIHAWFSKYKQKEFLVTIHEEGTCLSWRRNISVDSGTEKNFMKITRDLFEWSVRGGMPLQKVKEKLEKLGSDIYMSFIGNDGQRFFDNITPTAILLNVDETILNLPWELIAFFGGDELRDVSFGRIVTTRIMPKSLRDPVREDDVVKILTVANPTLDLPATEKEIKAIKSLDGDKHGVLVEVDEISREEATKKKFKAAIENKDYDIIHFAGHAYLDRKEPENSALSFADGPLTSDEAYQLAWKKPPYMVFNSACETGRAVGGKRLVSEKNRSNGLAAAFLAAGVQGYIGYFWPVTDSGAALFAEEFYNGLFNIKNVGTAFLAARQHVIGELSEEGDLTGFSAVLFGDAATKHRRDMAEAH